jgi:hypothetical protein
LPSSTGTSTTRPRTCETMGTLYFTTRTSEDEGAKMLSSMISTAMPTIGMMTTVTCEAVFQGSHFSLMKISQTKNE